MLTAPLAAKPPIAGAGHRVLWDRRDGVGLIVVTGQQEVVDLLAVETGEAEIEVRLVELL